MIKRVLKWAGLVLLVLIVGLFGFAFAEARAFDSSVGRVYDVPLPKIERATDPAAIARGRHLAESLGECMICHGDDMAGGRAEKMGPLGTVILPNARARAARYSDGELARLIKHGIKRDGHTVRLMPSVSYTWWPDEDVAALIGWLRSEPPAAGDPGVFEVRTMGKVLDRFDSIPIDQARRIDHEHLPVAPAPAPDASYGYYVGTACRGCHGPTLSGGPIPGAPPDLAVPRNLTPHETGLKGWSYDDFTTVLRTGKRRSGEPLNEFMPVKQLDNLNELEKRALWAYLQSVPPKAFGGR
jgi:mono/diheme cytochrome c family protein